MHSFCVWHLLLSTTFWFFQCCFMYQSLISFGWFSVVLIGPKKVDWIHWLNEWVFSIVSIPSSTILLHFFCHAAAAANSLQLCPTLCDPTDRAHQAPPSLGFSRQEHWSGLPFPSPSSIMRMLESLPDCVYC